MIVKNEFSNIKAIFNAVKDFVDYYIIVDTGSTDGTQDEIRECTKGWLEGEVHERPWVGFSTNRNQALDLARAAGCKWAFIMDADDDLIMPDKKLKWQDGITYFIPRQLGNVTWEVPNVLWLADDWKWIYEIHEVVVCSMFHRESIKNALINCNARKGHRSENSNKILLDIELLKNMVQQNPSDSRSWFYLASSYATIGDAGNAMDAYKKRAVLGGWNEELCVSHFMIARLKNLKNEPAGDIIQDLFFAHRASPDRAEPLYSLANIYRTRMKDCEAAYPFARLACTKDLKSDFLFADINTYSYGCLHEYMLSTFVTKRKKECRDCCDKLSNKLPSIPEPDRGLVENDIKQIMATL